MQTQKFPLSVGEKKGQCIFSKMCLSSNHGVLVRHLLTSHLKSPSQAATAPSRKVKCVSSVYFRYKVPGQESTLWHSGPMLLKVQRLQQWAMGPTLGAWGPRAEKKEEALHRLSYK